MPCPRLTAPRILLWLLLWSAAAAGQSHYEITARIPGEGAATPAVAESQARLAWLRARVAAGHELCRDGAPPAGRLVSRDGPRLVTRADGRRVWLYRMVRETHGSICDQPARRFFDAMSSRLPAWMQLRRAPGSGRLRAPH